MNRYSERQHDFLRQYIPGHSAKEVAAAFNDAESKNLMVQTAMEAGYELFKKETEKMGLVLQSDMDEEL